MLERIVLFFFCWRGVSVLPNSEEGKQTPFCALQPRCLTVQAMEPRTKAYSAKIVPYLFMGTLVLPLSGGIIKEVEGAPRVVNGIMGETVLLSVMVPHDQHVVETRWKFGPQKVILGDSKGKIFKPLILHNSNYSQLILRLDMHNETTLRITNVAKGDDGVYKVEVQFKDGSTHEEEFQVKLYDPVPAPHINKEVFSTTEGCNITLLCQVPEGRDLSVKWLMRDPNNSRQDQHIPDGSILNLSLNSNTPHSEYICVVTNPVDQKNASISLQCPKGSTHIYLVISFVVIAVIALIVAIVFIWNRKKAGQRNGAEDPQDVKYKTCGSTEEAVHVDGKSEVPNGIGQTQRHSENNQQNGS